MSLGMFKSPGECDIDIATGEGQPLGVPLGFGGPYVSLFGPKILEIMEIIHDAGGLVYADGANLNALLGLAKLGDLGFDIAHSNLHKTYSTPHGSGASGSGTVLVTDELTKYLPTPVVGEVNGKYLLVSPERTLGRLNGFQGSFGIAVRAYT
jgi:glycine dehydrogenase subunit 2